MEGAEFEDCVCMPYVCICVHSYMCPWQKKGSDAFPCIG